MRDMLPLVDIFLIIVVAQMFTFDKAFDNVSFGGLRGCLHHPVQGRWGTQGAHKSIQSKERDQRKKNVTRGSISLISLTQSAPQSQYSLTEGTLNRTNR
jgi:hypothetical protein